MFEDNNKANNIFGNVTHLPKSKNQIQKKNNKPISRPHLDKLSPETQNAHTEMKMNNDILDTKQDLHVKPVQNLTLENTDNDKHYIEETNNIDKDVHRNLAEEVSESNLKQTEIKNLVIEPREESSIAKSNASYAVSIVSKSKCPDDISTSNQALNKHKEEVVIKKPQNSESIQETISRKPSSSSKASAAEIKNFNGSNSDKLAELTRQINELQIQLEIEIQKRKLTEEENNSLRKINSQLKLKNLSNNENYLKLENERVLSESTFLKKENSLLLKEIEELNKSNTFMQEKLQTFTNIFPNNSNKDHYNNSNDKITLKINTNNNNKNEEIKLNTKIEELNIIDKLDKSLTSNKSTNSKKIITENKSLITNNFKETTQNEKVSAEETFEVESLEVQPIKPLTKQNNTQHNRPPVRSAKDDNKLLNNINYSEKPKQNEEITFSSNKEKINLFDEVTKDDTKLVKKENNLIGNENPIVKDQNKVDSKKPKRPPPIKQVSENNRNPFEIFQTDNTLFNNDDNKLATKSINDQSKDKINNQNDNSQEKLFKPNNSKEDTISNHEKVKEHKLPPRKKHDTEIDFKETSHHSNKAPSNNKSFKNEPKEKEKSFELVNAIKEAEKSFKEVEAEIESTNVNNSQFVYTNNEIERIDNHFNTEGNRTDLDTADKEEELQHSKINKISTSVLANNLFDDDDDGETIADILNKSKNIIKTNHQSNTPMSIKKNIKDDLITAGSKDFNLNNNNINTAKTVFDSDEDVKVGNNAFNLFNQVNSKEKEKDKTELAKNIQVPNKSLKNSQSVNTNNPTTPTTGTQLNRPPKLTLTNKGKPNNKENNVENIFATSLFDNNNDDWLNNSTHNNNVPSMIKSESKKEVNIPKPKSNEPIQNKPNTLLQNNKIASTSKPVNNSVTDIFNDVTDNDPFSSKKTETSFTKTSRVVPLKQQVNSVVKKDNKASSLFDEGEDEDFHSGNIFEQYTNQQKGGKPERTKINHVKLNNNAESIFN